MTVSSQNYMVRPGAEPQLVDVISELGIFGYVIGDGERIVTNKQVRHVTRDTWQLRRDTCCVQVGQMLRTKLSTVDEGGVAAGLGALDSVFLIEAKGCCKTEENNYEEKCCK